MSITYLDFENINTDDTKDIKCEAHLNLQTSIPINNYNKISISKIDMDVGSQFYFCRVPLKQPQEEKTGAGSIASYVGITDESGYPFNQERGWFETLFKFVVYYKSGSTLYRKEYPLLYKSNEVEKTYAEIGKRLDTGSNYYYDNFDEYFVSYNPNNMLSSFNICIKQVLKSHLNISSAQIVELLPKFHTDDKKLIIDNFSYGNNNDMQPDNNSILQVQYPEEVNTGTYPGHSTPGPIFCIGINTITKNLLYHGLVSKKYKKGTNIASSGALSEDYYFLKLDQILETSLTIPDTSTPTTKYNITSQYVNEFYDLGDIKLITIKGNLPCPPLYSIRKTKDYILSTNSYSNFADVAENVLFKLSINNNTLCPTRFIFQQPSITNNYSSLLGGLNGTNYNVSVEYVDKYNNSYDASLSYGDKLYIQLCVFI